MAVPGMSWKNLGYSLPIYTTRPHGPREETATYSQSMWMTLLAQFIIWLNVMGWGIYGIVELIGKLF